MTTPVTARDSVPSVISKRSIQEGDRSLYISLVEQTPTGSRCEPGEIEDMREVTSSGADIKESALGECWGFTVDIYFVGDNAKDANVAMLLPLETLSCLFSFLRVQQDLQLDQTGLHSELQRIK